MKVLENSNFTIPIVTLLMLIISCGLKEYGTIIFI